MTLSNTDIKWLHVELSSRCNAWCTACPRNNRGYGIRDGLVEQDLTIDRYIEVLESLPNLECVQFCGNDGDPIISKNILDVLSVTKKFVSKIQIHTNGSLRTPTWWANLAELLSDINHDVWFGIDGLQGVHEIYRQGTSYSKIIDNATAFINNGGVATWQFIPFAHNEHQLVDCIKKSKELNFHKFKLIKILRNNTVGYDYKTGKRYDIMPPTDIGHISKVISQCNSSVDISDCMHMSIPSVYLSSAGKLFNCCYFDKQEGGATAVADLLSESITFDNLICLKNCGK